MEANGIPHAPLEARRSLRVGLVRDIFDTVTRSKECFLNNFQLPASHIEPLFNTRHLGRRCHRSPAPGYLDEELMVAECIGVVMEEEIEHHRFAVRDLAVLEANYTPDRKGAQSLPDVDLGNVIELEIALLSDEVRRSRALLEELLDPEFCEIGASGRMRTRPEVLDEILADQPGVRSPIQTAEMEASAVGEDLILVRYVSDSNGRRARRSSLWRRAGGSWRVVFHQGTLL